MLALCHLLVSKVTSRASHCLAPALVAPLLGSCEGLKILYLWGGLQVLSTCVSKSAFLIYPNQHLNFLQLTYPHHRFGSLNIEKKQQNQLKQLSPVCPGGGQISSISLPPSAPMGLTKSMHPEVQLWAARNVVACRLHGRMQRTWLAGIFGRATMTMRIRTTSQMKKRLKSLTEGPKLFKFWVDGDVGHQASHVVSRLRHSSSKFVWKCLLRLNCHCWLALNIYEITGWKLERNLTLEKLS